MSSCASNALGRRDTSADVAEFGDCETKQT